MTLAVAAPPPSADGIRPLIDPVTGKCRAWFRLMPGAVIEDRLERNHAAFLRWRKISVDERLACVGRLERSLAFHATRLARAITSEMGKVLPESFAEVANGRRLCRHLLQSGSSSLQVETVEADDAYFEIHYQPLGPILLMMPWNFPVWQVLRSAVPLLLAGNGVVLKHAPTVPDCARLLEEIFAEAGFPTDLFCHVRTDNAGALRLIHDRRIAGVSFTGSPNVGRLIAREAGSALKKVVLELGGNDAWIIGRGADPAHAADSIAQARLRNNGQSCLAPKRVLVHRSLCGEIAGRLHAACRHQRLGHPLDPSTTHGPLARHDLRDRLHTFVGRCRNEGDVVLAGGWLPPEPGAFYPATLLQLAGPDSPVFTEEIFGPVVALLPFERMDEAIRLANATPYGLGAAIFDSDTARAHRLLAEDLEIGTGAINARVQSHPAVPFGGVKASGFGREMGGLGLREFTNAKVIRIT